MRDLSTIPTAVRHGPKRRMIDPTTCQRDYTPPEVEFMKAMDRYKREAGRPFPTWSEVLEVLRSLGYVKVGLPRPLPLQNGRAAA